MTRREAVTAAIELLLALAAMLLSACSSTPPLPAELPAELPHYPCERQESGKTIYYSCSAYEWLEQQRNKR